MSYKQANQEGIVRGTAWAIVPFVDLWDEFTQQAAEDVLTQEGVGDVRLLLVANDCSDEELEKAEEWVNGTPGRSWCHCNHVEDMACACACHRKERVLLWNHRPALPALGATWNTALEFCWQAGATEALVSNNDVRLHAKTLQTLLAELHEEKALFVSAVGVQEGQFDPASKPLDWADETDRFPRGGPDYSCFLISKECHSAFPFDPELTWFSDNDHHYRMKLAGEGERIFSVNVPYLHYGSRTINRSPAAQEEGHRIFRAQRDYYVRKWGGVGGEETFTVAFGKV